MRETMTTNEMVELIDCYIARLQEAKVLLQASQGSTYPAQSGATKRRPLTPEGRHKIAAAQRARWAKVKEAMKY